MKSKKHWKGLMGSAGFMVLILDSRTALEGMHEGLELCLGTLVPSLFPFFLLSIYLTSNLRHIPGLHLIGKLCGMPTGSEVLLLTGLLGGYPVGAENVAQAYRQGKLSKSNAERILAFCNNAGPSFLFGVIGPAFDQWWVPWFLWGSHMLGALSVGIISHNGKQASGFSPIYQEMTLPQALKRAISAMAQVCGWVVIFRMITSYLQRWVLWTLPVPMQVVLSGMLELANGCVLLPGISPLGDRIIAAAVLVGLGGGCVTLQTKSVTDGLSLRYYFPGKILQCCISCFIIGALQFLLPVSIRCRNLSAMIGATALLGGLFLVILRKKENNSSFSPVIGV